MEIGITPLKRIMKKATDSPVSTDAAYWLSHYLEDLVIEKTKQAEKLLQERNKIRDEQGLAPKKRLSRELIQEVVEH